MDIIENIEKFQQQCMWNHIIVEVALNVLLESDECKRVLKPESIRNISTRLVKFRLRMRETEGQRRTHSDGANILGLSHEALFPTHGEIDPNDQKAFASLVEKSIRNMGHMFSSRTSDSDDSLQVTQKQNLVLFNCPDFVKFLEYCKEYIEVSNSCKESLNSMYKLRTVESLQYFRNMLKTHEQQITAHTTRSRMYRDKVGAHMCNEAPLFPKAIKILSDHLKAEAESLKEEIEQSKKMLQKYKAIEGPEWDSIVKQYRCVKKHLKSDSHS